MGEGLQLDGLSRFFSKRFARLQKNFGRPRDVIYGGLSDEVEITLTAVAVITVTVILYLISGALLSRINENGACTSRRRNNDRTLRPRFYVFSRFMLVTYVNRLYLRDTLLSLNR